MIEEGQIWISKKFSNFTLKVLKVENKQFFVKFSGPRLRSVKDHVTSKYIKDQYFLKGKEKRK